MKQFLRDVPVIIFIGLIFYFMLTIVAHSI